MSERFYYIDNYLYQGNLKAALNNELLEKYNINVVFTLLTQKKINALGLPNWHIDASTVEHHLVFDIMDNVVQKDFVLKEQVKLWKTLFSETISFIQKTKNVLIHCNAGLSRSAIAVINIYSILHNLSYEEAHQAINKEFPKLRKGNPEIIKLLEKQKY